MSLKSLRTRRLSVGMMEKINSNYRNIVVVKESLLALGVFGGYHHQLHQWHIICLQCYLVLLTPVLYWAVMISRKEWKLKLLKWPMLLNFIFFQFFFKSFYSIIGITNSV